MKKHPIIWLLLCLTIIASGCTAQKKSEYDRYSYEFLGAFDTVIQIMGYAKTQEEFETLVQIGENRFMELNKLFDIYNDYEGINNVKTINDNAGIKPVEVKQEIIDLMSFSMEWYNKTNGKCNIALGSMLSIWHEYRDAGLDNPKEAQLPPVSELQYAMQYTDINNVIVDDVKNTVYLKDKNIRLDVGAVAKGFASEIVAREFKEMGNNNLIISSGGNVRVLGKPLDGIREKWGIGLQNPDGNPMNPDEDPLDIVFLNDKSVVTSGDYQRYYTVGGKRYHHLIDPESLMPADYYRSVTIVTEDSGFADFMSTTLFLTPYEEGRKLADSLGIDVIWIMKDKTIKTTDNVKNMMKNLGGASNKE